MKPNSLGGKIALYTSSLIVLISLALFASTIYQHKVIAHDLRMQQLMVSLKTLSAKIENPLYNYDIRQLRRLSKQLKDAADAQFVWILDAKGRLITDGTLRPEQRNQIPQDFFVHQLVKKKASSTYMDGNYHWLGNPVQLNQNDLLGYVVLTTPQQLISDQLRNTIISHSQVLLLALVVGIIGAFWLGKTLTHRLRNLSQVAEKVGQGEWQLTLNTDNKDEIGLLAKSLNNMAQSLSQTAITRDQLQQQVEAQTRELQWHKDNLEILVEKRTQELLEAQNTVESANRVKSEFIASMSHELRTPLNIILGFTQVLELDESRNPEEAEAIALIHKNGENLLALVNDILDLSPIHNQALKLSIEPTNISEIVQDCYNTLQIMADKRQISMSITNSESYYIWADPGKLKQVLLNLLSNAVKFNHKGGQIQLSYKASTDGHLRLSVSDTGIGIPPDQIETLFKPYTRPDQENAATTGTGIGLAISLQLIEEMNGRIGYHPQETGSEFWIELPLLHNEVQLQDTTPDKLF